MATNVGLLLLVIHAAMFYDIVTSDPFETLSTNHKVWWAKRITSELYSAGRLTESQLKYATESGFKTVISIPTAADNLMIMDEKQPDAYGARRIVETLGGRVFETILPSGDMNWKTVETIRKFSEIFTRSPKPVLVYCSTVKSATFVSLGYLANQTRYNITGDKPMVNSETLYKMAASLGIYDETQGLRQLVAELTGELIVASPPKPDVSDLAWYDYYWWAKPVYKNWYSAGQIWTNYIHTGNGKDIKGLFKTVINVRNWKTMNGTPSQEEVTLLNIKDGTGTYKNGGRQTQIRLEATRIDANKPPSYVSDTSRFNYMSRNTHEFGDVVGYDEGSESGKFTDVGLTYVHTPMALFGYDPSFFHAYNQDWLNAGKDGKNVLVHCAGGMRATFTALLIVGKQEKRSSAWAVQRGKELGYDFEGKAEAMATFTEVLGSPEVTSAGQSLRMFKESLGSCLIMMMFLSKMFT